MLSTDAEAMQTGELGLWKTRLGRKCARLGGTVA